MKIANIGIVPAIVYIAHIITKIAGITLTTQTMEQGGNNVLDHSPVYKINNNVFYKAQTVASY